MKKFTSLLLLLLFSFVGGVKSAYADGGDWTGKFVKTMSEALTSTDQLTDGYYVFRNVGHCTFLRGWKERTDDNVPFLKNVSANDEYDVFRTSFEGIDKSVMDYVVHLQSSEDGTFTIQFNTGRYMPKKIWRTYNPNAEEKQTETSDEAGNITFSLISGTSFCFKSEEGYYADGNGDGAHSEGTFTGYPETAPTDAGGNAAYQIYPVTLANTADAILCTWTASDAGGNVLATKNVAMLPGETASNPFTDNDISYFYTNPQVSETDLTVSADNKGFHVTYTEGEKPFEFSTADNPKWYTIHFANDASRYLVHVGTSDANIAACKPFTADFFNTAVDGQTYYDTFNGALWAFVRADGGIKLLSKQTGKYVKVPSYVNQATAVLTTIDDATPFVARTNSYNRGAGFSMQYAGVKHACIGSHILTSSGNNAGIYYNVSDDSQNNYLSSLYVTEADNEGVLAVAKAVKKATLLALKLNEADETKATAGTQASLVAATAAADAVTSMAELDAVDSRMNYPVLAADAFYRIRCVNLNDNENAYVTTDGVTVGTDGVLSAEATPTRATSTAALVPQLWHFVAQTDGSYKVVNANTGRALGEWKANATSIKMPASLDDGGNMTFTTVDATFNACHSKATNDKMTMFQMHNNGHRINAFQGANEFYLADYDTNHDNDAGNYWQLIKVTTIPVTIGTTGWTSVAFPFETTIPAGSEVKAYTASTPDDNGKLRLTALENGVIPAGQGVFLVNENGATTVNLDLTATNATLPDGGNTLSGATAKRSGFTSATTYLLALDKDNNPALVKSELTWVPANKAYLNVSSLTTLSVLGFSFGTTDGISNAVAEENAAETYFDLNGRPVLYPQHGIFVTSTGRKVYIK